MAAQAAPVQYDSELAASLARQGIRPTAAGAAPSAAAPIEFPARRRMGRMHLGPTSRHARSAR